MSSVAFILAIALITFVAALASISPLIWLAIAIACMALCIAIAKSNIKSGAAKLSLAALGCLAVVGGVLTIKVSQFFEQEINAPLREAQAAERSIEQLLVSADPQRFSKALTIAQVMPNPDRKNFMTWQLHRKITALNGDVVLADSEIAAALATARAINACPDFVPAALVRQTEPADLLRTLQKLPDRDGCQGADSQLVQRFIERCKGRLAVRCKQELPKKELLLAADQRYTFDRRYPNRTVGERTGRAYALRELIQLVWPRQFGS
jgi:hypothetical protein